MAQPLERSPTYFTAQRSNSRENVGRQSRREPSMERSRLPTLRRSRSSASSITSTSKMGNPQRARSSSVSRHIQPQNLFAGSTQRAGSSSSCSKFLTPMGQGPRLSRQSRSPKRTVSPWMKSSANKDTQKKELSKEYNRIREVLALVNCNIQLTKPVNLRDFVGILTDLFNIMKLDSHLTFGNYITIVPTVMKKIYYTGNCTASFLKTVNTMHNWPHVVNMLSYLCDLVEAQCLSHPEKLSNCSEITQIFRNTFRELVMSSDPYKKAETKAAFTREVLESNGVNIEELNNKIAEREELMQQIETVEEHVQNVQTEYETREAQESGFNMKMAQQKKQIESLEIDYQNKITLKRDQMQEFDLHIAEASEKKILLEEQLKKQKYTKEYVFQLEQEINNENETCRLLEERNKKLEIEWNDSFLELSKVNGKLIAAAIEFNLRLKTSSLDNPEIQEVLVPESGFSRYTKEEFELILSECLSSTIHERISDLKQKVIESNKECDKHVLTIEDLKEEIASTKAQNNHALELQKRQKQKLDHKLKGMKNNLQAKKDKTLSLIDERDKILIQIDQYQNLCTGLDQKIVELEHIFDHNRKNADKALSALLLNISKMFEKFDGDYQVHIAEKKRIQSAIDYVYKNYGIEKKE